MWSSSCERSLTCTVQWRKQERPWLFSFTLCMNTVSMPASLNIYDGGDLIFVFLSGIFVYILLRLCNILNSKGSTHSLFCLLRCTLSPRAHMGQTVNLICTCIMGIFSCVTINLCLSLYLYVTEYPIENNSSMGGVILHRVSPLITFTCTTKPRCRWYRLVCHKYLHQTR